MARHWLIASKWTGWLVDTLKGRIAEKVQTFYITVGELEDELLVTMLLIG